MKKKIMNLIAIIISLALAWQPGNSNQVSLTRLNRMDVPRKAAGLGTKNWQVRSEAKPPRRGLGTALRPVAMAEKKKDGMPPKGRAAGSLKLSSSPGTVRKSAEENLHNFKYLFLYYLDTPCFIMIGKMYPYRPDPKHPNPKYSKFAKKFGLLLHRFRAATQRIKRALHHPENLTVARDIMRDEILPIVRDMWDLAAKDREISRDFNYLPRVEAIITGGILPAADRWIRASGVLVADAPAQPRVSQQRAGGREYTRDYARLLRLLDQVGDPVGKEEALSSLVAWQIRPTPSSALILEGRVARPVEMIVGHLKKEGMYPQRERAIVEFFLALPKPALKNVVTLLVSVSERAGSEKHETLQARANEIAFNLLVALGKEAPKRGEGSIIIGILEEIRSNAFYAPEVYKRTAKGKTFRRKGKPVFKEHRLIAGRALNEIYGIGRSLPADDWTAAPAAVPALPREGSESLSSVLRARAASERIGGGEGESRAAPEDASGSEGRPQAAGDRSELRTGYPFHTGFGMGSDSLRPRAAEEDERPIGSASGLPEEIRRFLEELESWIRQNEGVRERRAEQLGIIHDCLRLASRVNIRCEEERGVWIVTTPSGSNVIPFPTAERFREFMYGDEYTPAFKRRFVQDYIMYVRLLVNSTKGLDEIKQELPVRLRALRDSLERAVALNPEYTDLEHFEQVVRDSDAPVYTMSPEEAVFGARKVKAPELGDGVVLVPGLRVMLHILSNHIEDVTRYGGEEGLRALHDILTINPTYKNQPLIIEYGFLLLDQVGGYLEEEGIKELFAVEEAAICLYLRFNVRYFPLSPSILLPHENLPLIAYPLSKKEAVESLYLKLGKIFRDYPSAVDFIDWTHREMRRNPQGIEAFIRLIDDLTLMPDTILGEENRPHAIFLLAAIDEGVIMAINVVVDRYFEEVRARRPAPQSGSSDAGRGVAENQI